MLVPGVVNSEKSLFRQREVTPPMPDLESMVEGKQVQRTAGARKSLWSKGS